MNALPSHCTLLGQQSRLDDLTSVFRNRPSQVDTEYVVTGLVILSAIVLGMWILSQILARQERHKSYDNAWMLFFSLCKAHGLSWPERWLLWRVARHQRLRDPARLFLEPWRLADEHLSPALRLKQARLRALGQRLFAGVEESGGRPPASTPEDRPPRQPAPIPPTLAFPVADNPALDIPPWTQQSDARPP